MEIRIQKRAIHQFSPSCGKGDGVSNGMFFTRELLREFGYNSEIYCDLIAVDLIGEVKPLSELELSESDLLIFHFSLGYKKWEWLNEVKVKKILVYHNITPPQFLPNNELPSLSLLGRQQLKQWCGKFIGAIGDSHFNSQELEECGYRNIKTVPLLVDVEQFRKTKCDLEYIKQWEETYNILFVGRFCEHKNQLELVKLFQLLKNNRAQRLRLFLVGGITSDAYYAQVVELINQHQLQDQIVVTGKVNSEQLIALYRSADVYVSLSEHEGFGMPLLEAMLFDVPVVAKNHGAISSTMGDSGILLPASVSLEDVAENIFSLMSNASLRRKIRFKQKENCQRFDRSHIKTELAAYLSTLDIDVDYTSQTQKNPQELIQLEGPFDSSYSLAIVNRELAIALEEKNIQVSLRSKEGYGDFEPSSSFLEENDNVNAMYQRGVDSINRPEVVMRNCYPPVLGDMQGCIRLINSYGWEETGFPQQFVEAFNLKLDLITVVSLFVKKVLRDNGVRIPIAVVGNGVDHLLQIKSQAIDPEKIVSWKKYRFLHISSCFPRKGVDVLLKAFGQSFTIHDDVTLIIKTFPNPHNEVEKQLQQLKNENKLYPHVVIINEDYTNGHIKYLYENCNAVVVPSRGEGFGLPIAEAMVFKLPVITTNWSGQLDFVSQNTAWLCDYDFAKAESHFCGMHSVWANPNTEHLAQLMNEVYQTSKVEIEKKTNHAHEQILKTHKWSNVADRTISAISALKKQTTIMVKPKIAWISTWNVRCGISSYSSFLSNQIPQDRLLILANYTAERMAKDADNVSRCWTADMNEKMDYAFEKIIESQCKVVVIQYNFGFFSLQTLAELLRQLKSHHINVHIYFHATADTYWGERKISIASVAEKLRIADRIYVHAVEDINRLKEFGLINNVVHFPQGLMPHVELQQAQEKISNKSKKVIASYGFLLPHKGILELIRAFSILAKENEQYHLMLVNAIYPASVSEQELNKCKELIDKEKIGHKVSIYSEFLPDLETQSLLQQADLIVYPYQATQESSSAAVRMGLAANIPIAVTPLSIFNDVKEVVNYLPGITPEEIAMGISQLLSDESKLQQSLGEAQAWVSARQWPELSLRLLNTIDGIANETDYS